MVGFQRDAQGRACLGGTPIEELLAQAGVPTPSYLYDLDAIAAEARGLVGAFGTRPSVVAYAVKANTAASIVRTVAEEGAGADVVSGAELEVALACGVPPERIVMSGVAKLDEEIDLAVSRDIHALQCESVEEIERIASRARALGTRARVSLRVNPSVEIEAHAHVATGHDEAKFGIPRQDIGRAWQIVDAAGDALVGVGVSTHVGSMLGVVGPYLESARVVCEVARERRSVGSGLQFVDFGGGFGIDYGKGPVMPPAEFARAAIALLPDYGLEDLELIVEPGRAMVGPHGVVVARVVQQKQSGERRWAMIDAGMNDLLRPALYQANHRVEPLERPPSDPSYRVVGPVCESADDFGEHRLGEPLPQLVVLRDAGAYGFAMASEYNGRALPSEVFVRGGRVVHVSRSAGKSAWVQSRLNA